VAFLLNRGFRIFVLAVRFVRVIMLPKTMAHSNRARMALGYATSYPGSFPVVVGGIGIVDPAEDFDRNRFPQPPSNVV
jgi:hypothetical protein